MDYGPFEQFFDSGFNLVISTLFYMLLKLLEYLISSVMQFPFPQQSLPHSVNYRIVCLVHAIIHFFFLIIEQVHKTLDPEEYKKGYELFEWYCRALEMIKTRTVLWIDLAPIMDGKARSWWYRANLCWALFLKRVPTKHLYLRASDLIDSLIIAFCDPNKLKTLSVPKDIISRAFRTATRFQPRLQGLHLTLSASRLAKEVVPSLNPDTLKNINKNFPNLQTLVLTEEVDEPSLQNKVSSDAVRNLVQESAQVLATFKHLKKFAFTLNRRRLPIEILGKVTRETAIGGGCNNAWQHPLGQYYGDLAEEILLSNPNLDQVCILDQYPMIWRAVQKADGDGHILLSLTFEKLRYSMVKQIFPARLF